MHLKFGSQLTQDEQKTVLETFTNRFTGDHKPAWSNRLRLNGDSYKVQFRSDAEWLEHTEFKVTSTGKLDLRVNHCYTHPPTWPEGKDRVLKVTAALA